MRFTETSLAGAFLVEPEPVADTRGYFARLFCAKAFAEQGLSPHLEQIGMSYNRAAGTLRGLHLQREPHAEDKVVRVVAGSIYDVIVDLRAGSKTFGRWFGVELSAANKVQLAIPKGFAHGFQTLTEDAEVLYHISAGYQPGYAAGVRWNDPDLAITWPEPSSPTLSDRDRALPLLRDFEPIRV